MSTNADDVDQPSELQRFHTELLALVKLIYRHERKNANSDHSKKLLDYVRKAPDYGLETSLAELKTYLTEFYQANKVDLLDGYDDCIFKPKPLLLKLSPKIYQSVGCTYNKLTDAEQDEVHMQLMRVFIQLTTDESDKAKLTALVGEKQKVNSATAGGDGMAGILSSLMSGDGAAGIGSLLNDIVDKLKTVSANPDDPDTLNPEKIGQVVKELINDKSKDSLFAKMQNNPMIAKLTNGNH